MSIGLKMIEIKGSDEPTKQPSDYPLSYTFCSNAPPPPSSLCVQSPPPPPTSNAVLITYRGRRNYQEKFTADRGSENLYICVRQLQLVQRCAYSRVKKLVVSTFLVWKLTPVQSLSRGQINTKATLTHGMKHSYNAYLRHFLEKTDFWVMLVKEFSRELRRWSVLLA